MICNVLKKSEGLFQSVELIINAIINYGQNDLNLLDMCLKTLRNLYFTLDYS
jgi:hypothetical protein